MNEVAQASAMHIVFSDLAKLSAVARPGLLNAFPGERRGRLRHQGF